MYSSGDTQTPNKTSRDKGARETTAVRREPWGHHEEQHGAVRNHTAAPQKHQPDKLSRRLLEGTGGGRFPGAWKSMRALIIPAQMPHAETLMMTANGLDVNP